MDVGRVYKLISQNDNNLVYIGSTTRSLSKRLMEHRSKFKSFKKGGKMVKYSAFKVIESGDCIIELLESNIDKTNLLQRERYWIEAFKCVNMNIPSRTVKEYHTEHKQQIKEYHKEYRQTKKHCTVCSRDYSIDIFKRHLKSKKHMKNVAFIT